MPEPARPPPTALFLRNTLEAVVRIGVLVLLGAWCFDIIRPFIPVVVWGVIIAIGAHPLYERLRRLLGGRAGLASLVFTLLLLLVLILPVWVLAGTVFDGSVLVADALREGRLRIPPPTASVLEWPLVGEQVSDLWALASENLGKVVQQFQPQLAVMSGWILGAAAGAGFSVLVFLVAIVFAALLLARADSGQRIARAIFHRLAGERGEALAFLAGSVVRSVTTGILGVALIQAILAGFGFMFAGLPGAGLLAMLVLVLCVVQIGPWLVFIPASIWMFSEAGTGLALAFTLWCVFVGLLENILKPILLGRGVDVPMFIIFMGAIGGFLSMGIIGLFVGSIVLSLGYVMFVAWLKEDATPEEIREIAARDPASPPRSG